MTWPTASVLNTPRFALEPLAVRHAEAMVAVLAPTDLYAYTGGEPPTLEDLRVRYTRQEVGHSPTDDAGWLNWIIRAEDSSQVIGYVQATLTRNPSVTGHPAGFTADIAWLITPAAQGEGAATEAALVVVAWLKPQHVTAIRALVHPAHTASERVARAIGLDPTPQIIDGERVWEEPGLAPA